MSNIETYQGFSEADADQDLAEANAMSGSVYMDLEQDENVLRFLPVVPGMKSPYRKTALHYIEIPGHERKFVFACPRVELKEPCIACAREKELVRSKNSEDREAASNVGSSLKVFANVLNRKIVDSPPMVLGFGKMVLNELTKIRKSQRTGGDFTNPGPTGFDIIINKTGEGLGTRYTVHADRNPSPLASTQKEIDAICAMRHDLEACITPVVPDALLHAWASTMATLGPSGSAVLQAPLGRSHVQVPRAAVPAQAQVGAGLMSGAPVASASDAEQQFDDDFNPIV